tara:strand:- start:36 stop:494 length:459 start_codon:yes stop_codon:yes gene_type:complete
MISKKIATLLIFFLINTQLAYANYGFYNKVANTCKHYRVPVDKKKMFLTETKDGYHFTIELQSRRTNFEMVMLVGFISIGQAIKHQEYFAKKKKSYKAISPKNTYVTVLYPSGRNVSSISAMATNEQVIKLAEGKVDTAGFMRLIKNSIQTL